MAKLNMAVLWDADADTPVPGSLVRGDETDKKNKNKNTPSISQPCTWAFFHTFYYGNE